MGLANREARKGVLLGEGAGLWGVGVTLQVARTVANSARQLDAQRRLSCSPR